MQPTESTKNPDITKNEPVDPANVAETLKNWSLDIVGSINSRNFEILLKYASDSFTDVRQTSEGLVELRSAQEAIDFMRRISTANPEYSVEIIDASVELNEKAGLASVWISLSIAGKPAGTRKENMVQLRWRRIKGGQWVCVKHSALNAVPSMHGV